MSSKHPWEMLETDTLKSFEAFTVYRDMEDRTLEKVAKKLGKSNKLIERWSAKHNWRERVAAWDEEKDRIIRQDLLRDIGSMRRRHVKLATDMLTKAAQALARLPDEEIKAADISRMVEIASKLERISRGDVGEVVEERDGGQATPAVQFYIPDNGRDEKGDEV